MSLIDYTYFKGSLTIGDISNGNSPVVGNTITTDFIPQYEKDYLLKALGYPLYKAFIAGLEEEEPAQKWLDLRDGVEYEVSGKTYKWDGFVTDDKISPIAYYVYCEYMHANAVQSTGTGTAVNNKQNATSVSPAAKISASWVQMKRINAGLWHYLQNNKTTYTDYDSCRVDWNALLGSRNTFGI